MPEHHSTYERQANHWYTDPSWCTDRLLQCVPELHQAACHDPPGTMLAERGEECRGGGATDYVWLVWRVGKIEKGATMEWVL